MPRKSKFLSVEQWDELLDGEIHEVNLLDLSSQTRGVTGAIPAFRAAVYREAEKRWGFATVSRPEATIFRIQAYGPLIKLAPGAPAPAPPAPPAAQVQPPTTDVAAQLSEADLEALLGPCSCGQSPQCTPDCARVAG